MTDTEHGDRAADSSIGRPVTGARPPESIGPGDRRGAPADPPADGAIGAPVQEEQAVLTVLYRRLDELRRERIELRDRYIRDSDGTPGGRVERDVSYARHAAAVIALNTAEDRLCFGRLDYAPGSVSAGDGPTDDTDERPSIHVGRMGIFEESGDHRQLLMDWRAPSARPFYVATAAAPLGIQRRRHIRTRRRRVESVTDDYLDITGLDPDEIPRDVSDAGVAGESVLLEALLAPRTGRMHDIVATIQSEQDAIIRADRQGILVVQGGPGTGKTAVALHRAAYLLYTYREQLAQRGILIVGPNPTFLQYIGQVLPSLGENAVVLSTIADLYPGVSARAAEDPAVAVVKGRTAMTTVVANAVLHRQSMPSRTVEVRFDGAPDGVLQLDRGLLRAAQQRAWQSRRTHNAARGTFVRRIVDSLVGQVAERLGRGADGELLATADDLATIRQDLQQHDGLRAAVAGLWPVLTPQRLIAELLGSAERIDFAAGGLPPADRALLMRADGGAFTPADVPLLDEAAELLGPPPAPPRPDVLDRDEMDDAESILDLIGATDAPEEAFSDEAPLVSMLTAANLRRLRDDDAELNSTAERAAADREWTYGHVIVDEAQELSPMAWRAVMRRCPVRSMTLVGDLAQTSDRSGATSWERAMRSYARGSLRVEQLTVNYRTPAEIMTVAEPILAAINPAMSPPTSIRDGGQPPWLRSVPADELPAAAAKAVAESGFDAPGLAVDDQLEPGDGAGTLAVIVPPGLRAAVADAVLPPSDAGDGDLRHGVVVLTVAEAKGLEFDQVIVVEPAAIADSGPHGLNDLYVAVTRATQGLGVLHARPLPAALHRLS